MLRLDNQKEVIELIRDSTSQSWRERNARAQYQAKCRAYYVGAQWIQQRLNTPVGLRLTRQFTNWVGDSGPIRATINRISRNAIRVAASTSPERLEVDALPPQYSQGVADAQIASMIETTANALIDEASLLRAARVANTERTIAGEHGIGLYIEETPLRIRTPGGEQEVKSRTCRAFPFDSTRLIVDPGVTHSDLRKHEYVIYQEVFTLQKVERVFGKEIADQFEKTKLPTVGQLVPVELEYHTLTGGHLYGNYATHSKTPGMRVNFVHVRDDTGRFGQMWVVLDSATPSTGSAAGMVSQANMVVVNPENPMSPFGGDGLPYVKLAGHIRPSSRIPMSDVAMMVDDQDKMNLIASLYFQQVYNYTQQHVVADKTWLGVTDDGDAAQQLARMNWFGNDRAGERPQIVQKRPPDLQLDAVMRQYGEDIREQGFRAESNEGKVKSHVPIGNLTRALEQADVPLDDRVQNDVFEYETIINVLTGTGIKALRHFSPATINLFRKVGLGEQELGTLAQLDPSNLPATLSLRQEAVRRRGRTQRRQDIIDAISISGGAISGGFLRRVMAQELDMPLSDLDKQAVRWGREQAQRVLLGEEYVPLPLGEYAEIVLDEFHRAMFSRDAERVPGGRERIAMAIEMQVQMMLGPVEEDAGEPELGMQDEFNLGAALAGADVRPAADGGSGLPALAG